MDYSFGAFTSWPDWTEPALGLFILIVMGFFAYMSAHLVSERKAGKQIPTFWEKEEDMGYGAGSYSKKPAKKKAKKAKKSTMKKKKK
tara:strand:- start:633 stop:893 length:261 start_codon:yes stop_codon:yes gene_type:complete